MRLSTTFAKNSPSLRSHNPLSDDQIRAVAPSIFADAAHESRSERYTYVPTIEVLRRMRENGFQPFMVGQTRVRDEGHREHTKHIIRMRHADEITANEVNEVILLNSHNGTSSFQLIGGVFRFVCMNGMVCGDKTGEVRVHHKGNIVENVLEGAHEILDGFDLIREQTEGMKELKLSREEETVFANAALALKYEPNEDVPAPITGEQLLRARRREDVNNDLWTTFNRVQENMIQGGLNGRSTTGRRMTTRPVTGIDQNVKLNRSLWMLAEGMRAIKANG
jgi:hypothetical protein